MLVVARSLRWVGLTIIASAILTACGGGGGGGGGSSGSGGGGTGGSTPAPAPTVTITTNPPTPLVGSTTTLTWSSTNATACTASGSWSGTKAVSGTEVITIAAAGTTTYTMTCTGAGGSANASVTVTVSPPPTMTLTANPPSVLIGSATTLTWSSTNSTACIAGGSWSGTKAPNGTEIVTPSSLGTFVYTLTCGGSGGSVNIALTVIANPPPPTVTITLNPTSIVLGASSTVTWSASPNSTDCTASGGWSGQRPYSGFETVTPTSTGNFDYTLTCTGPGGESHKTATLAVKPSFLLTANDPNTVSSQSISSTSGALSAVTGSPFTAGTSPCFITTDPASKFVYALNNGSANISVYALGASGALTEIAGSPFATGGHPNTIAITPSGKFAYVTTTDSGLLTYSINATTGALAPVGTPGTAAGAFAIDPSGKFAYASGGGNGIQGFTIDGATGALAAIGGSPFGSATDISFIAIGPSGKFAFAANASASTISAYAIDATSGGLTPVAGSPFTTAKSPRFLAIDPSSSHIYVANAGGASDNGALSGYSIDSTGVLRELSGSPLSWATEFPRSVAVDKTGRFLYLASAGASGIRAYGISVGSGVLMEIAGSPFAGSASPNALVVTQ